MFSLFAVALLVSGAMCQEWYPNYGYGYAHPAQAVAAHNNAKASADEHSAAQAAAQAAADAKHAAENRAAAEARSAEQARVAAERATAAEARAAAAKDDAARDAQIASRDAQYWVGTQYHMAVQAKVSADAHAKSEAERRAIESAYVQQQRAYTAAERQRQNELNRIAAEDRAREDAARAEAAAYEKKRAAHDAEALAIANYSKHTQRQYAVNAAVYDHARWNRRYPYYKK